MGSVDGFPHERERVLQLHHPALLLFAEYCYGMEYTVLALGRQLLCCCVGWSNRGNVGL